MTKPRVFIGSSKESKRIAQTVKEQLEPACDCVVWTDENFFKANNSTYENLVKKACAFDFAVFIGGKDDFVIRTSNCDTKISPRDNIYIEFGLYAGVLSTARTYFLFDKRCTVASDLFGITLFTYGDIREVKKKCKSIIETINQENKLNRLQLLPSTSLAIGYYENFLKPVVKHLFSKDKIVVGKKPYKIKGYPRELKVCVPTNLDSDFKNQAQVFFSENKYKKIDIDASLRDMGLVIDIDALKKEHKVVLLDCPQTLRAAFRAVEMVTGKDSIGVDENIQLVKEKEVRNFISTTRNLIITNEQAKSLVKFVRF